MLKKICFVLAFGVLAIVGALAQDARVELAGHFNYFGGNDEAPQFMGVGLRLVKLFAPHWGYVVGANYGRSLQSNIQINGRNALLVTDHFTGFEPGVAYHGGEGMRGFMADLLLRAGMQHSRETYAGIADAKRRYFHIGPELGLGFNAAIAEGWLIGGRAGLGLFVGDIGYARISGGISVSKTF
ncbi:MAG: hypothetical protein ACK4NS_09120 [Saprospiraceae bacterium]